MLQCRTQACPSPPGMYGRPEIQHLSYIAGGPNLGPAHAEEGARQQAHGSLARADQDVHSYVQTREPETLTTCKRTDPPVSICTLQPLSARMGAHGRCRLAALGQISPQGKKHAPGVEGGWCAGRPLVGGRPEEACGLAGDVLAKRMCIYGSGGREGSGYYIRTCSVLRTRELVIDVQCPEPARPR